MDKKPLKRKRYKCVVRNYDTDEITGYVEGDRSFYNLFKGETFYLGYLVSICTFFEGDNGREVLTFTQIYISEMELIYIDKASGAVKLISGPHRFTKKEVPAEPAEKPSEKKGRDYSNGRNKVYELTDPNGDKHTVTNLAEFSRANNLIPQKLSAICRTGKTHKGYSARLI